jgi:hypothetical protein
MMATVLVCNAKTEVFPEGIEVIGNYWTLGKCDLFTIEEAKDETTYEGSPTIACYAEECSGEEYLPGLQMP